MKKRKKGRILFIVIMFVILAVYLFPIFMVVLNSFKTYGEIFTSVLALPEKLQFSNYVKAWKQTKISRAVINNIIISGLSVSGIVLVTSMAGYRLSRDNGRLSKFLYKLFTVPFLIPFFTYMIPLVILLKDMNLKNSYIGIALVYISSSSMAIFLVEAYVKNIPTELDEAAYIDGCGPFRLFFKIIFPLMKPVISSVAVLFFLSTWNDFLLPMLVLTDSKYATLSINIYSMFGKFSSDWDIITASMVLSSIPVLILYLLLQKQVVNGMVSGALKS